MDNTFQFSPSEKQQPLLYNGGYLDTLYSASRPPHSSQGMFTANMVSNTAQDPQQNNPDASRWTPSPGYDSCYGFRCHFPPSSPGLKSYGRPRLAYGYAFDPSVPPPPFSCPTSQFPPTVDTVHPNTKVGPVTTYNSTGAADIPKNLKHSAANFISGPQSSQYDYQPISDLDSGFIQRHEYQDLSERHGGPLLNYPSFPPLVKDSDQSLGKTPDTQPVDEKAVQRRKDEQLVKRFLQSRGSASKSPESQQPHRISVPHIGDTLYGAVQLVLKLSLACDILRHNLENESVWTDSYVTALKVKRELQEKLKVLNDSECLDGLKDKLSCISKRRARQRRRKLVQMEDKDMEGLFAEKEAEIDKWRTKQIQQVEEKKMEHELKLAADSVLCEVRKKQADVKRMQDVLRSLEKLRKLRKDAASRKGIFPDQECDQVFISRLEELRAVMRKRTAVYSAEEKALMVMLEGEQEEERRKDLEKRRKKERERHLQRKQDMDTMLFGDEMPADPQLQPFKEYFTQGEHSLPALVQIRREWDVFLVAVDHPDGAAVPQGWVLPDVPSDQAWASVLHNTDPQMETN
uniref:programmed cell death protein 7 n=1 Tax=Centroberyx gerrardi TaxID=166262 RepID=UPI003AAEDA5C